MIAAAAIKLPDALQLQAWVPGFSMELVDGKGSSDDDFIEDHCVDCPLYFDSYDLDARELERLSVRGLPDFSGEITTVTVASSCPCHYEGLSAVDFPCEEGHDDPDSAEGGTYQGPPMLFSLTLWRSSPSIPATEAWSQAAYVRRTSNSSPLLCLSASDRSLNIHSSGEICWGMNDTPVDLFSLVEAYAISEFNDDLMPYNDFHAMRRGIADDERRLIATCGDSATARRREFVDGIYAAMLVVDPSQHCYCFSLLLAMGAKPQSDGLLVLPLVWRDQRSEDILISPPLDCGVSVLVRPGPSNAGLVIGQASCCNTYSPSPVPSLELAHA